MTESPAGCIEKAVVGGNEDGAHLSTAALSVFLGHSYVCQRLLITLMKVEMLWRSLISSSVIHNMSDLGDEQCYSLMYVQLRLYGPPVYQP